MAEINTKDLDGLSLTDKIKKLKEIEKDSKERLKEAKKLIKETESKIKISEIASDIIPSHSPVEISNLFKLEGNLEGAVSEAAPKKEAAEEESRYGKADYSVGAEELLGPVEISGDYHQMTAPSQPAKMEDQTTKMTYKTGSKSIAEKSVPSMGITEYVRKYSKG